MNVIKLIDNQRSLNSNDHNLFPSGTKIEIPPNNSDQCIKIDDVEDVLKEFDALTLKNLREKGVIVLESSKKSNKDDYFYQIHKESDGESKKYYFTTTNLIGVLNFKGKDGKEVQVEVGSRFSVGDPQEHFLIHMLEKAEGFQFDIASEVSSSNAPLSQILLALRFRNLMREARAVGPYKKYQDFQHNDLKLRGKLDISRHILLNGMMKDKIAYTTHEHTVDNEINHLFLYAKKYIENKFPSLLDSDRDASDLLKQIQNGVPTFGDKSLSSILGSKNIHQEIKHPYFGQFYDELRKVSLALLKKEGMSIYEVQQSDNEVNGIVFDCAILWEDYISALIHEANPGFIHSSYDENYGAIRRFVRRKKCLYPDFYLPKEIVLDTKFKNSDYLKREDFYQLASYVYLMGAYVGGLIYPPKTTYDDKNDKPDEDEDKNTGDNEKEINLNFSNKGEFLNEFGEEWFKKTLIFDQYTDSSYYRFYSPYAFDNWIIEKWDEKQNEEDWKKIQDEEFKKWIDKEENKFKSWVKEFLPLLRKKEQPKK